MQGSGEGKPKFFVWRPIEGYLRLGVVEVPTPGWMRFGPLGVNARFLHYSVARLLWLAINPEKYISELPVGWQRGEGMQAITIQDQNLAAEVSALLETYFFSSIESFIYWLQLKHSHRQTIFEQQFILADLENLKTINSTSQIEPN